MSRLASRSPYKGDFIDENRSLRRKNHAASQSSFLAGSRLAYYSPLSQKGVSTQVFQGSSLLRIIDQNALIEIGQLGSLADLQSAHQNWISDALQRDESKSRDPRWTESVAVGQREYVEAIQERLGSRAAGRKSIELRSGYQLKETAVLYVAN